MNQVQQGEAERLAAMASLGDPVRKKLFLLLRASPDALSCEDCAAALGLPKSTIRAHLDRLVAEGLMMVEFRKTGARTGPGSGRPSKLYAVAMGEVGASVPSRHYDLAADLLAAAVKRSMDSGANITEALADVAFEAGRELGAAQGTLHQVLAATGYEPRPDGAGGTIMANCPFHRIAQDHSEVMCALNGSLLNGALAGSGDTGHGIVPDAEATHCCARIVPRP